MHPKVWIKLHFLGALTVSTDASITGRVGGSITIGCTVTGPEVKKIQWMKYVNNAPVNILIDGLKFSGGSVSTKALTIHSLTNDDARQYQCTASNPGGYYSSVDKATVTVKCAYFFFSLIILGWWILQRYWTLQKCLTRLALIINKSRLGGFL